MKQIKLSKSQEKKYNLLKTYLNNIDTIVLSDSDIISGWIIKNIYINASGINVFFKESCCSNNLTYQIEPAQITRLYKEAVRDDSDFKSWVNKSDIKLDLNNYFVNARWMVLSLINLFEEYKPHIEVIEQSKENTVIIRCSENYKELVQSKLIEHKIIEKPKNLIDQIDKTGQRLVKKQNLCCHEFQPTTINNKPGFVCDHCQFFYLKDSQLDLYLNLDGIPVKNDLYHDIGYLHNQYHDHDRNIVKKSDFDRFLHEEKGSIWGNNHLYYFKTLEYDSKHEIRLYKEKGLLVKTDRKTIKKITTA